MSNNNFEGAFLELVPNYEEETIDFVIGWEFSNEIEPMLVEEVKNLLAGIFGLVSADEGSVSAIGEVVRKVSDFDGRIKPSGDNETEIIFSPDPDLMDQLSTTDNVVDLTKYNPKGKKH